MEKMKVRITFTEEVLGTASADAEIHRTYIASKAPDALSKEEEVAALGVDAVEEKSMTVFPKLEDGNIIGGDFGYKQSEKSGSDGTKKRQKKA